MRTRRNLQIFSVSVRELFYVRALKKPMKMRRSR